MNIKIKGKKNHPNFIRWFIYQHPDDGDNLFLTRRKPKPMEHLEFLGIIRARTLVDAKRRVKEIFNQK